MNESEVPNVALYFEIIEELIFGEPCDVWAMSAGLRAAVMIAAILFLIIYAYIVLVIAINFKKLANPFYVCVLSIAVSDFIILLTSMQEARMQSCVLRSIPARHIAWQSIGTLSLDGMLTNGFVLALTRFVAVIFFARESLQWQVAKYGVLAAWVWTVIAAALNHFGLVSKIWFEKDTGYHDQYLFPFQYVHFFVLLLCVGGVLVLYLVALAKLAKLRAHTLQGTHSYSKMIQEFRMLIQCLLIFAGELMYLYATFWFGYHYLHLGSAEVNARLNYVARPLQGGINLILYLTFSSEIRRMAFPWCANMTCCNNLVHHTRIHDVETPQRWSLARHSSVHTLRS
uniref:G-protein coupled receptors family 1 profile domain-containing protein n=1 Tax=Plectus sambesii TaxID=2011161 RepID=A0A914VS46_9BILA